MSVGARVSGLDCSQPIPPEVEQDIYDAWLEYGFLVFTDEFRTVEEQMRLSRCFGELEQHPIPEIWVEGEPYLIQLGGDQRGLPLVYDGELKINALGWHRDTGYTVEVCKGGALRMIEVPERGGTTLIADTAMAYDDLSVPMKRRIENLECKVSLKLGMMNIIRGKHWKTVRRATEDEWKQDAMRSVVADDARARYPSVVQPLVVTHPESGRRCLYLCPVYDDEILGLAPEESDELLDELIRHATRPEYCYEHHWKPYQIVVWDNRRCMHAASGYHPSQNRLGHRTTLAGSLNTGRFYDPADAGGTTVRSFDASRD
jgi:taurine dioxygenase